MVEINILETMLQSGQDNALLRFTLGQAFMRHNKYEQAISHFAIAVELDPNYTAAWKNYARALEKAGKLNQAIKAYTFGLKVAEKNGDMQALKEMRVFLQRIKTTLDNFEN
jgi:tetratricopeptide (TPR) repeat protein